MSAGRPLRRLGFVTLGLFDPKRPEVGHEQTLEIIELGERLGLDSAWVRQRHLQHGISSPVAVLAAASQRTSRIELGTAVVPLGVENPLRLAEDLATVDVLAGGRLNPGVSIGRPIRYDDYRDWVHPDTWPYEDLTFRRVERLIELLRGDRASAFSGTDGIEEFSDHVQPHVPGLVDRLWYGAGSLYSARWAGEHGLNLLTSNVVSAEHSSVFDEVQLSQIRQFRAVHPLGEQARVSQGLVVIPTDSADAAQVARYEEYVRSRDVRVGVEHGPRRTLFAADLVGRAEQIADWLAANRSFGEVDEVAFALPFTFEHEDYLQILTDIAERLGPALGWEPAKPAA